MSVFNKKLSLKIAEQFPEFVRMDQAGVIPFLEKYYEFLESAELIVERVGDIDHILLEQGAENKLVYENSQVKTDPPIDYQVMEESGIGAFENGEIITGSTSGKTATIRVEDINGSSTLYISSQTGFLIGERITGGSSLAIAYIKSYRSNPVENVSQLMEYASVDETVDSFFDEFKKQYLRTIPKSLASGVHKRNLLKNITDLYRAKGSRKGHELFFRVLLDETADLFYPTEHVLRVSDGNWGSNIILRVIQDQSTMLLEDLTSTGNINILNENGSHFLTEDNLIGDSDLQKLVGLTITQSEVFDTSIELGGSYYGDGFDSITKAVAQVESVTQFQLGSELVTELVLNSNSISGTFVVGQDITSPDPDNEDVNLTGKIISILTGFNIASSSQYFSTTDSLTITASNGDKGRIGIDQLTKGTINEIIVGEIGSGYEIGEVVVVDNSNTNGTGLLAKISVVNGGFAPETGSLSTEFNMVQESGNAAVNNAEGINTESGMGDDVMTETGRAVTELDTDGNLVFTNYAAFQADLTGSIFFTQEENYRMAEEDHIVLEDYTVWLDGSSGNKIVQEAYKWQGGSAVANDGDITDIVVINPGRGYSSVPLLTITTVSGTNGKIFAKGTNVGKIKDINIFDHGIHYTGTSEVVSKNHYLIKNITGQFSIDETIVGGTSGATGVLKSVDTDRYILKILSTADSFIAGETITASGGATAIIDSFTPTSITATIGATANTFGRYVNQDGWLSEKTKRIQDSFYYQDFSYVVKTASSIINWRNDVINAVHPAGFALFGEISSTTLVNAEVRIADRLPELIDARDTYTPELFSLLTTIFSAKFGRRLGTTDQGNVNTNPELGIELDESLNGNRDVTMNHSIVLDVYTLANRLTSYAGHGVMLENVEKYKFANSILDSNNSSTTFRSHDGYNETRNATTYFVVTGETVSGYRIQDWADVTIGDVTNYPKRKHNITPPTEITLTI